MIRIGGFGAIPPVVKNLLIINVLIWFGQQTFQQNNFMENLFALHDVRSVYFKPHQLISYIFLHDTGGFGHLFFNMLAVYMFGSTLENHWGAKRFLIYYVICGVGAGLLHLGVVYYEMTPLWNSFHFEDVERQKELLHSPLLIMNQATLGASGSVFGILAAFAYLFPNTPIYLYLLFPVKAKWLVLFYAGLELYLGIVNSPEDNVAHWAHLGGAAVGILIVMWWNKTNRKTFY
jgi:membrane associated rhomboid family serine protease